MNQLKNTEELEIKNQSPVFKLIQSDRVLLGFKLSCTLHTTIHPHIVVLNQLFKLSRQTLSVDEDIITADTDAHTDVLTCTDASESFRWKWRIL